MSADNSICTDCHFKTAYPKWKKTRPEIFPFMKSWIVKKKKEDGNGITVPILPASANNKNEKERKETDTESLQL